MKAPITLENLPTPEETAAVLARERPEGTGPNWAALSAGFVCPGAGQFLCGKKGAGIAFISMFFLATLIAFIPMFKMLAGSIAAVVQGDMVVDPTIPWLSFGGGIGLAILVWIAAMIHAVCLKKD